LTEKEKNIDKQADNPSTPESTEKIKSATQEPSNEKPSEENQKKTSEKTEINKQKKKENSKPIPEETTTKQKKSKKNKEEPKKTVKKQDERDEDFQYIVRIANTDVDGDKKLIMGVSQIKGIGRHLASLIVDSTGLDKKLKIGQLKDDQIEKIKEKIENIDDIAPGWMLNHRKDIDTGEDIHLISIDVDLRLRDDVNLLKMIRSYRGIRHESSLPVRGQRTRANNRKGLTLGVSKRKGA
jgi:small subunit ribosomal protein S13